MSRHVRTLIWPLIIAVVPLLPMDTAGIAANGPADAVRLVAPDCTEVLDGPIVADRIDRQLQRCAATPQGREATASPLPSLAQCVAEVRRRVPPVADRLDRAIRRCLAG